MKLWEPGKQNWRAYERVWLVMLIGTTMLQSVPILVAVHGHVHDDAP